MITNLMVIQNITDDGTVEVYQIMDGNFQWTFENKRSKIITDKVFFPFSVNGTENIIKRNAGSETRVFKGNQTITFCDDYGVPAGTVVGILFPKNYIPEVMKFKDKPFIPIGLIGQPVSTPPGQMEIHYNYFEKRCSIIFNIHQRTLFGFKCISRFINDDEYPRDGNTYANDLFDISINRELLNIEFITSNDLKIINDTLSISDIGQLEKILNELLIALKKNNKIISSSLLTKTSAVFMNAAATTSSLITIADSYKSGGLAHKFIAKVLEHASL